MTLLSDFKTEIGDSTSTNDQYYIDNFLRPALNKLSELCTNIKLTTVTLSNGVQSYTLTSSLVASPVVGSAGIYDLILDGEYYFPYDFRSNVTLQSPTILYFIDSGTPIAGSLALKYKGYYSSPTLSPYVETDAPSNKIVYTKQWAVAHYREQMTINGNVTGLLSSKSEENLSVSFGGDQNNMFRNAKAGAEEGMRDGGLGDTDFYSIQVI